MRIALRFRERVKKLGAFLEDEFDAMSATISATWDIEHYPDGGHKDVTIDSLTGNQSVIPVYSGFRFLAGPWLMNEVNDPVDILQAVIYTPTQSSTAAFNPAGFSTCIGVVVSLAGNIDIQGISCGTRQGRLLFMLNRSDYAITLKHNHGSAQSEDRINAPNGADHVIRQHGGSWLYYNPRQREWLVISP